MVLNKAHSGGLLSFKIIISNSMFQKVKYTFRAYKYFIISMIPEEHSKNHVGVLIPVIMKKNKITILHKQRVYGLQ